MGLDYWLIDEDTLTVRMPPGGQQEASRFYGEVLGLEAIPGHDGLRFRSEGVQLAFDIEVGFRPVEELAAMVVSDFEALLARLAEHGVPVGEGEQLEFFERMVVADPFGNRLRLLGER